MKNVTSYIILSLLAGLFYSCRQQDMLAEAEAVTLDVQVLPRSLDATAYGENQGTAEERKIHNLWFYVFDYTEDESLQATAKSVLTRHFENLPLSVFSEGYDFQIELRSGRKVFYVLINPTADLSLYPSVTEKDLKEMKLTSFIPSSQLPETGLPMACSFVREIQKEGGSLRFSVPRSIAKLSIYAVRSQFSEEVSLNNVSFSNLTEGPDYLPVYDADSETFDKQEMATRQGDSRLSFRMPDMPVKIDTDETLCGEFYLNENWYGSKLASDQEEGLRDPSKESSFTVALSNGMKRTFDLNYIRRNDHLKIKLSVASGELSFGVEKWTENVIYPDYQ